jgi:hypothetical protein
VIGICSPDSQGARRQQAFFYACNFMATVRGRLRPAGLLDPGLQTCARSATIRFAADWQTSIVKESRRASTINHPFFYFPEFNTILDRVLPFTVMARR